MRLLVTSCVFLVLLFRAEGLKIRGNELFDELLDEIRDADDIRVMPLEDLRLGFSRKIAIVTVHGEAKLHQGTVAGLDTAERIDDAQIITHPNGTVVIRCTLGMGVIEFNYKGTITFMGAGPAIKMQTHTGYVTVNSEIQRLPDNSVKVTCFTVKDFEKLKVRFTGLGPLTWAANLLIAPAVNVLKPLIRKTVEVTVRRVVERRLPSIIGDFTFE